MPDTKYISRARRTKTGGGSLVETDRRARQGRITQQHSTGRANTNTSQDDAAWEHQTAASTFTVPMAALLCLPWRWVAVKHLTRRGQARELQSHGEGV